MQIKSAAGKSCDQACASASLGSCNLNSLRLITSPETFQFVANKFGMSCIGFESGDYNDVPSKDVSDGKCYYPSIPTSSTLACNGLYSSSERLWYV